MNIGLSIFNNTIVKSEGIKELTKYNDISRKYGLELSEKQAAALIETRSKVLKETGRVEFGAETIGKIIFAFCDSPYLSKQDYEDTLHELIDIFYIYKNQTNDRVSDDDLIKYMKEAFDGSCNGSLELLCGRELFALVEKVCGKPSDDTESDGEENDE